MDKPSITGLLSLYNFREDKLFPQEKQANDQVSYIFDIIAQTLPLTNGKLSEELKLCQCYLQHFQNYIHNYPKSLSFDYYQQIEKAIKEKDKAIEDLKAQIEILKSDKQISLF